MQSHWTVSAGRTNRRLQRLIIAVIPAEVCSTANRWTPHIVVQVCVCPHVRARERRIARSAFAAVRC
jgi:hypothetical protein